MLLLTAAVPGGLLVGAWWAAVARRIPMSDTSLFQPSLMPRRRRDAGWDAAMGAGAAIPLCSALLPLSPVPAVSCTLLGWLLLGIAVCDERTLHIPHAPWIAGLAGSLAAAGAEGGTPLVASRVAGVAAAVTVIYALAALARVIYGRDALGSGDYGVVALLAALCGPQVLLDVVLVAAVLALGISTGASSGRKGSGLATVAAALATTTLGPWGVVGGAILIAVPAAAKRSARWPTRPAPFGACLATAVFVVLLTPTVPSLPVPEFVRQDHLLRHLLPAT